MGVGTDTGMNHFSSDIIPADWARWSASRPSVVRPLEGGLTNRSFLIASEEDLLVLRKNSPISDALDLNRAAEAEALRLADKAGLCAPLIHCDPGHGYLVTRYIEGALWDSESAGALQQLAALLRSIHDLPSIDARLDLEQKIARYWQSIDSSAEFYAALSDLAARVERHITQVSELGGTVCLCHNDLLKTNLIVSDNGCLHAIDWEYAATGDPFYELAVIVEEYELGTTQQRLLLAEYLLRPVKPLDWQRLGHWRVIYRYLSVLWYAVQWTGGAMTDSTIKDRIFNEAKGLSKSASEIDL